MAQEGSSFGSQFVEVTGASSQTKVREDSPNLAGETVNPNGKIGRVFQGNGKCAIHTFDGLYLSLPETCLKEHHPSEPLKGGFDLAWPHTEADYSTFGHMVCESVLSKGYCVIQTYEGGQMRGEMHAEAEGGSDDFLLPREEMKEAYLGRGSSSTSRLRWLPTPTEIEQLEETNEWDTYKNPVAYYMDYLTNLAYMLDAGNADILGFKPSQGLRHAFLREPVESTEVAEEMVTRIDDSDVKEGRVASFLDFVQRRRLCLLYVIDSAGGDIQLHPRADLEQPDIRLPIVTDRILVFRHDMMSFSYSPSGRTRELAMQGWCLEVPQEIQLDTYDGAHKSVEKVLGGGPPQVASEQVHIMCAMCRFPGGGYRLGGAWLDWMTGTDTFTDVPQSRWDMTLYWTDDPDRVMGKSVTRHAAFCGDNELRDFDNKFFGIDDEEAALIEPIKRVLLESCYEAFALVGWTMETLKQAPVALAIADIGPDQDMWVGYQNNPEVWLRSCSNQGLLTVNRCCHTYGITGPAYQIDTACSSTLVSANTLEKLVRKRESATEGLSMGCQNILLPFSFIGLSGAGMLGRFGRCLTFDRSANGYNRGEGSGGLYLRSTSSTKDLQDRIACYVSGFINQDGRSASLTAPNGPSQQECMRASLKLCGVTTDKVAINENHGTGTALGDPIECGSIRAVFRGRQAPLPVSSGKSHMGHLESTAGSVGLLKIISSLIYSCKPPNSHLRNLNPHIEFDGFPGFFPIEQCDIGTDHACGSLNSFGFGGTNSRGDMWARTLKGYKETGGRKLALERLDWVTVPCARCFGPMCWLCGMALTESTPDGKHNCSNIRELLQSYEYCSNCYDGNYICGDLAESSSKGLGAAVGIVGSWSNFTVVEEMAAGLNGSFEFEFPLGDTCLERFYLVVDGKLDQAIFPSLSKANQLARVLGPAAWDTSKSWLVNGRRDGMPAGTVYTIKFSWLASGKMSISWESTSKRLPAFEAVPPNYTIIGSFTDWQPVAMEQSPSDPAVWLYTAIVSRAKEAFLLAQNGDQEQLIYPLDEETEDLNSPVLGPDEGGVGKSWLVQGSPGETLEVRLRIKDGDITVMASTESIGEKSWKSLRGPVKDRFFVQGSWMVPSAVEPMEEDLTETGVYKLRLDLPSTGQVTFQIVVNLSAAMRMYPMSNRAPPGMGLTCGPDAGADGNVWEIIGRPGQAMEITLDLSSEDMTQIVTCLPAQPQPALAAA
jgi:polyketide synthase-associated protein